MYGGRYDPGMGPYPAPVWWNLDGSIQHPFSRKSQLPLAWIWPTNKLPELYPNCKSAARLGRWLSELPRGCATAAARRGMGPGVLLVVAPSPPTHGARRG